MRRRWVEITLMLTLVFVVPGAWAATRLEPADHERCGGQRLTVNGGRT